MAVAHGLSFPGLFAPGGVLGAGPQTTAWLYFLWHGGFPLFVFAYIHLKDRPPSPNAANQARPAGRAIAWAIGGLWRWQAGWSCWPRQATMRCPR